MDNVRFPWSLFSNQKICLFLTRLIVVFCPLENYVIHSYLLVSQYFPSDRTLFKLVMSLERSASRKVEHDTLSILSGHMYNKHRNIFIGIGVVVLTGLTSFVVLRNYAYNTRDRLAKIRREIQAVTPGSESVFESYHAKLKKRQEDQSNN